MYSTLLLALAVTVGAPKPKDPPQKDTPSIVGEWVTEKLVAGGVDVADSVAFGLRLTLGADGTVTTDMALTTPQAGTYKTDTKQDPPEIDLIPAPGKGEPSVFGVYKLDGDTLVLCFAVGKGAERPKKVESPAGSTALLITLKRAKKD